VLAAKRAAARTGYPWALAGLFSAASAAFNIAHAPDRPVAQLVFAMAPVALVLTTHLLMQQASWRHQRPPIGGHEAGIGRPQPDTGAAMGGHEPAMPVSMAKRTFRNCCVGYVASARVWHGHQSGGLHLLPWLEPPDCRLARLIPYGGGQARPPPGLQ
jgi:uncharacterized protein DUF2637